MQVQVYSTLLKLALLLIMILPDLSVSHSYHGIILTVSDFRKSSLITNMSSW